MQTPASAGVASLALRVLAPCEPDFPTQPLRQTLTKQAHDAWAARTGTDQDDLLTLTDALAVTCALAPNELPSTAERWETLRHFGSTSGGAFDNSGWVQVEHTHLMLAAVTATIDGCAARGVLD